jgi:hypothetical protein
MSMMMPERTMQGIAMEIPKSKLIPVTRRNDGRRRCDLARRTYERIIVLWLIDHPM